MRIPACTIPLIGLAAVAGFAFAASSGQAAPPTLDDLAWLAGAWNESKNGVETEEHWMTPKGNLMLGMNRTVRPGGKTLFESLRIGQVGEKVIYYASPGGRAPATEFPLVKLEGKKAVFENPNHPFPRRIIYWLDTNGSLGARIEGTLQGREASHEWRWSKVK
jgi:hypothetical protein